MRGSLSVKLLEDAGAGQIDMLSTGIEPAVGLEVQGGDLAKTQEIGRRAEQIISGSLCRLKRGGAA